MSDPPREEDAAARGTRFPESVPRGRQAVVWATLMCVWGAFLLVVGLLAHHTSVWGVVAGVIFLVAGLRWLRLARGRQRAERDADAPQTR